MITLKSIFSVFKKPSNQGSPPAQKLDDNFLQGLRPQPKVGVAIFDSIKNQSLKFDDLVLVDFMNTHQVWVLLQQIAMFRYELIKDALTNTTEPKRVIQLQAEIDGLKWLFEYLNKIWERNQKVPEKKETDLKDFPKWS